MYEACIRPVLFIFLNLWPVLLYGSETWPLTVGFQERIEATDRRMLGYMVQRLLCISPAVDPCFSLMILKLIV